MCGGCHTRPALYSGHVGSSIGLPGIWVLAAVTVGGSVAGIAGIIVRSASCSRFVSAPETGCAKKCRSNFKTNRRYR